MNILIINVSLRPNSVVKFFPVGLGYIATAMNRAGFSFDLLDIDAHRPTDEEIESAIRKKTYDIVCIGCMVSGYKWVKKLAALVRNLHPNATLIAGNTVASSIPEILLTKTEVDIAVMGEGDITIVELLRTLSGGNKLDQVNGICYMENGGFCRTPDRPLIKNLDALPWIDFSLFDHDIYINMVNEKLKKEFPHLQKKVYALPINTARGCIGKCTFCYHAFQNKPYRFRSPQSIVEEAGHLIETYHLNTITFPDELTFFNKKHTLEFAQTIIESGLKFAWDASCRADLFDRREDLNIIEKMVESGCESIVYALESADPSILKAMNKRITVDQFLNQTRLLKQTPLTPHTNLVFGYPQETPETIARTFDVCIEAEIYPSVGFLLPQPGSSIYNYAIRQGVIKDEEAYLLKMGDRQDLTINITRMSDQEFMDAVTEGAKRCSQALNVGLPEEKLIKSGGSRHKDDAKKLSPDSAKAA